MTDGAFPEGRDDELDLAFEEDLRAHLRAALEGVGPSEEAEDRMLANLMAAQAEKTREAEAAEAEASARAVVEPIELPAAKPGRDFELLTGGAARKKRASQRRLGLAVAASILVVALGVGVFAQMGNAYKDSGALSSSQEAEVAASADEQGNEAQYEGMAAPSYEAESSSAEVVDGDAPMMMQDAAPEAAQNARSSETGSSTSDSASKAEEPGEASAADSGGAFYDESLSSLTANGGALIDKDDPSYPYVTAYREIHLSTGEVLAVVEHDGSAVRIDSKWVEDLVGEAQAFSEDGTTSTTCWVYRLPVSDDGLYVVRYLEDGAYYAIRVVEGTSR